MPEEVEALQGDATAAPFYHLRERARQAVRSPGQSPHDKAAGRPAVPPRERDAALGPTSRRGRLPRPPQPPPGGSAPRTAARLARSAAHQSEHRRPAAGTAPAPPSCQYPARPAAPPEVASTWLAGYRSNHPRGVSWRRVAVATAWSGFAGPRSAVGRTRPGVPGKTPRGGHSRYPHPEGRKLCSLPCCRSGPSPRGLWTRGVAVGPLWPLPALRQ